MQISKIQNNTHFKGYDAIRLRGLYMQGLNNSAEKRIYSEMKQIADKEGVKLFLNQNNSEIREFFSDKLQKDYTLSIWGQDRKAFIERKGIPTILWHSIETTMKNQLLYPLNNYNTEHAQSFPRGGNYYIGYKNNGEKWLLINSMSAYNDEDYKTFKDLPAMRMLPEIFDVKPENIYYINEFLRDLDETVRPIGYPYILVNDFDETIKNVNKLEQAFPKSEIVKRLKKYARTYKEDDLQENKIKSLKEHGFIPIKIGARYEEGINFINALAFKNQNNKISYITNSTKGSCPELEYLEHLFEEDLKSKTPNIDKIYFVSGGEPEGKLESYMDSFQITLPSLGFSCDNAIMDILANKHGGIHCMTAEIPNFERLV